MAYGTVKIDTITFTDGGVDKSVSVSGLTQNPTFSGNVTVTGTVSGTTVRATTVSGVTVTGTTVNAASGVFTTQISGAIVKVPAGSAGAPTVQVGTGATVVPGLYSPGTDQLAFSTSGTGQLFIDSSGNVGIGGAPTAVKLNVNGQIVGNGSTYALRASNGSGTGQTTIGLTREGASTDQKTWELMQGSSGEILLRTINDAYSASQNAIVINRGSSYNVDNISLLTMGNSRLYINSSGNVGIGTTSPADLLHVAGTVRVGATTGDASLEIGAGATGNRNAFIDLVGDTTYSDYGLRLIRTNGGANSISKFTHKGTGTFFINCEENADLAFQTNNTLRAYFSGTTFKLANSTDIRTNVNTGNLNIFGGDGTGANIELHGGSHATYADLMTLDAGEHWFRSQDGSSERLRITSAGRVGIGTSTPGSLLTVSGNALSTNLDVTGRAQLTSNSNWNFAGLNLKRTASNTATAKQIAFLLDGDTDNDTTLTSYLNIWGTYSGTPTTGSTSTGLSASMNLGAPNAIIAHTNGSERLRIASSGSLLVGTSSDGGGALLQINGDRIRVATAKTPSSASATGTTGEICWDASYIYVCTATNTWKRAALSTW